MSKKNTAPAKKPAAPTPAAKAPARKISWGTIIPVALLAIGLIIMTVCFFNVNSQLAETRAQLAAAQQLNAGNQTTATGVTPDAAPVGESTPVTTTALDAKQAELDAANAALADKQAELDAANAALADKQAELDAAYATIAEKDALLAIANDAVNQAIAALTPIAPASQTEEAPAEIVEETAEETAETVETTEEVAEEATEEATEEVTEETTEETAEETAEAPAAE